MKVDSRTHTSLVTGIELENSFLIRLSKQLPRETQDTGGLSDTRHARDDDMRHVALSCDDLQALNGLCISDNIIEEDWAVFLDPVHGKGTSVFVKQEHEG